MAMSVRAPAVAGRFYAGTAADLEAQIEDCFTHDLGPGSVPTVADGPPELRAVVAPHAGYPYSGPVAAHGFAALARSGTPETAIIVGPNHTGRGAGVAVAAADRWQTPLGEVTIDDDLRETLRSHSDEAVIDDSAHVGEHAAEVEIPFLQYLFDDIAVLPISMRKQDSEASHDLGAAMAAAASDRNVVFVASTDMTHYEPHERAVERDRLAIERMEAVDPDGLIEVVRREDLSMCGYGAVAASFVAAREQGASHGELYQHATSGDTTGDRSQVVGYCSMGVR
jgi:hypothetical protein